MPDLYSVAYIAEIYGPGAIIFAADLLQFAHKKKLSMSYKIIEISTNRKPVCDFLLVFHCKYMSVVYYF